MLFGGLKSAPVMRKLTFQRIGVCSDLLHEFQVLLCIEHLHISKPWCVVKFEWFECRDVFDVNHSVCFPPRWRSRWSAS